MNEEDKSSIYDVRSHRTQPSQREEKTHESINFNETNLDSIWFGTSCSKESEWKCLAKKESLTRLLAGRFSLSNLEEYPGDGLLGCA